MNVKNKNSVKKLNLIILFSVSIKPLVGNIKTFMIIFLMIFFVYSI